MTFKGLKNAINVQEQQLETPDRTGFVAVEWGGTEIDQFYGVIYDITPFYLSQTNSFSHFSFLMKIILFFKGISSDKG